MILSFNTNCFSGAPSSSSLSFSTYKYYIEWIRVLSSSSPSVPGPSFRLRSCFFDFFFSGLISFTPPAGLPSGFAGGAFPSAPFVPSAEGLVGGGLGPSGRDKAETSVTSTKASSLDSLSDASLIDSWMSGIDIDNIPGNGRNGHATWLRSWASIRLHARVCHSCSRRSACVVWSRVRVQEVYKV